jgi:hypothetical protein
MAAGARRTAKSPRAAWSLNRKGDPRRYRKIKNHRLDEAVADLSDDRKALVRKHFITTSRYEYMFWDAAWNKETWPVDPRG